jgi:type IV pilus assembly protein PilY1
MKRSKHYWFNCVLLISCLIFVSNPGFADDTCIFTVTADDVPPNIVILLDNGAEMEQIAWPSDYDNSIVYPAAGSVFTNANGYGIVDHGGTYYLVPILSDLTLGDYTHALSIVENSGSRTWTINGNTVTLPAVPSSSVDADGIKDNASNFRYSQNYLNWIFYSGNYAGNGSDLPDKSRFYYAKKAIMTVAKLTSNKAKFGLYDFTSNHSGASNVQPLGMVVSTPLAALPENNTLDSSFVNNVNNMGTVTYSPLAEGLASVGGYYGSPSSHVVGEYCQKSFAIVLTPGVSSYDNYAPSQCSPASLSDYDQDGAADGIGEGNIKADTSTYTIPTNLNGSTYLDDVAHYLYTHDIVGYQDGFQNVITYTIGFMGDQVSNLFLINTSNNGNGNVNLYDTTDPEYGKYHFTAESPDTLSSVLIDAISDIISKTTAFTAPVVPVTRTTSGNRIYLAFFKPGEENFWEGNVTKFGLSDADEIVDIGGNAATWPNGAIKEDAVPYWATKNWADSTKSNYIHNSNRTIYTYLGGSLVEFNSDNVAAADLGNPTHTAQEIIDYIRGADVFDEDEDGDTTENREIITGDVLHSEPCVVQHDSDTTMVFFGANDGMLHAVSDSDGTEAWAFIPPDQLPRLKDIVEGSGHQHFVDSSPKVYISEDEDRFILVCGERKGGTSYFALDITDPSNPSLLWIIDQSDISELGETWSEPQFGRVKTSDGDTTGTPVFFIGGGYSSNNSLGKAVIAINVLTGAVVKKFTTGMNYSIASSVRLIDGDTNGFVDKVYVGDLGGQMWRFGKFTDGAGDPLDFPNCDENISNWTGQIIFDSTNARKFFHPPSVTLEKEYDLVFMGTGDREDACGTSSSDRIYCVKDTHASTTLQESDLVDVTSEAAALPDLDTDQGWYIQLAAGEKAIAEGIVFYKTLYITTFTPNDEPCLPGGVAKLYALNYKTGEAVLDFDGDGNPERSTEIGGGIPSKPVMIITEDSEKLLISTGSTNPDAESEESGAGIVTIEPLAPPSNFCYLCWKESCD